MPAKRDADKRRPAQAGARGEEPTDPEIEALRDRWFEAPDLAAQQKLCRDMQTHFWQNPGYVPLGMYDQPTAFRSTLEDVHDGWPQF